MRGTISELEKENCDSDIVRTITRSSDKELLELIDSTVNGCSLPECKTYQTTFVAIMELSRRLDVLDFQSRLGSKYQKER